MFQRNVYISGLSLFLLLVIKRVLSLIMELGKVRKQRDQLSQEKVRSGRSCRKVRKVRKIRNDG